MEIEKLQSHLPESDKKKRKKTVELGDIKEKWELYVKKMEEVLNNADNYVNHGASGVVYSFGKTGFCTKLMRDRSIPRPSYYKKTNTALEEFMFMKRLQGFESEGVRIPGLVEIMEGKTYQAILMEQLDAVNLQEIINGRKPVPEKFELDHFFDSLDGFIQDMHSEKDILHNDLEFRNIMVDNETGTPYLVDFGMAEDLSRYDNLTRARKEDKEWRRIDNLRERVAIFLKNYQKKKKATFSFQHNNEKRVDFQRSIFNEEMMRYIIETVRKSSRNKIIPIRIGNKNMFISTDPNVLVGHRFFNLGDKAYYLGFLVDDLE